MNIASLSAHHACMPGILNLYLRKIQALQLHERWGVSIPGLSLFLGSKQCMLTRAACLSDKACMDKGDWADEGVACRCKIWRLHCQTDIAGDGRRGAERWLPLLSHLQMPYVGLPCAGPKLQQQLQVEQPVQADAVSASAHL